MANQYFKDRYWSVLYAPETEYIKDHCFLFHNKRWHMFSISGNAGEEMSTTLGNEEKLSHSVSSDLCDWKLAGHCLSVNDMQGVDMIWAPYIVEDSGTFYMFYTKCIQPFRDPVNWKKGAQRKIGLAVSDDLYRWKPESLPEEITGKDPHVMFDSKSGSWILYVMDGLFPGMTAWRSSDLINWKNPVQAFYAAPETLSSRNIYESPYILYYASWDKYILFLNFGYSVSENPLKFDVFHEYTCFNIPNVPDKWLENQKYFHPAIGFAGEIVEVGGEYYRSSCFGPRNAWKIKFFKVNFYSDGSLSIEG